MKNLFTFKKLSALLLAILLVLTCVACDTTQTPADTSAEVTTSAAPQTEAATTAPETTAPATTVPDSTEAAPGDDTPADPPVKVDTSAPILIVPEGRIKNIIIVIGDGMGKNHIASAEWASGREFTFDDWTCVSANTDSANLDGSVITEGYTDSSAAATALASGKLTVNGYVGIDHQSLPVTTILDYARQYGKATGVVTTDTLAGATPAGFTAHAQSRDNADEILRSQLTSGVDLLCGAPLAACENMRADIEAAGFAWCNDFSTVDDTLFADKVYWQFDMTVGSSAPSVWLQDATVKALDYLDQDDHGFVLMVEQAHIDKSSHESVSGSSIAYKKAEKCVNNLSDTVDAIIEWLGDRNDTAIIVTADHETGGLIISDKETAECTRKYKAADDTYFYYNWTSGGAHSNAEVNLYIYGFETDFASFDYYASAEKIKNINTFDIMYDILVNPPKYD